MMTRTRALISSIAGLPAAVEQLHRRLSEMHNDVSQIWSLLRNSEAPVRYGTVMLLWESQRLPSGGGIGVTTTLGAGVGGVVGGGAGGSSFTPYRPGFASATVPLVGETESIQLQLQLPVPEGAWLVAMGCHLQTVFVGHDVMDLAMPKRSPMCRLSQPVPLGVLVRCVVVPS